MAFDFKKEYKEFYLPKNKPSIVEVPSVNYIAVRGRGDPNEEDGDYKRAVGVLYAVVYTLKMSCKTEHKIAGFYEYVVPPLEGFWEQEGVQGADYSDKSAFKWISVIRLPEFVTPRELEWAKQTAAVKKKLVAQLLDANAFVFPYHHHRDILSIRQTDLLKERPVFFYYLARRRVKREAELIVDLQSIVFIHDSPQSL